MARQCEDWLASFVEYASFGEAPLKMLFWTGVSTVAAALQRRVWIDQKYFQWIPNFYVILVAPPGIVSKSTTANVGMNLARAMPQGTINFGPDVITWQALITALTKVNSAVPDPRSDHMGEFYPMAAVTFCSDELGNLLKPKDNDLVDALVSLWDGKQGSFKKETKNSGSDAIENPWVNIIGCTTPAWIAGNFPEYMIGGGFTSRCVFVYADQKRQLVAYPDENVPARFEELKKRLIHDLEIMSMMFGEYTITPAAREWGRAWYKKHWDSPPPALTGDQFAGYLARKQTHVHKLAMVLSAAKDNSLLITERDLIAAAEMVTSIEADMPRVFARIGQSDITRGSYEILSMVERYPGITQTDLYRALFRTLSFKEFRESLDGVINSHQIRSIQTGNTPQYYPVSGDKDERKDQQVH